jgi:recombination protein RecA
VALVFVCHKITGFVNPLFSLIIEFQKDLVTLKRALHRPTPFRLSNNLISAQKYLE